MKNISLPIKGGGEYRLHPTKIIALGLNYADHIKESVSVKVKGFDPEVPEEPILFPKTPNVLIPHEEKIVIPGFLNDYDFENLRTDYEAELAFIIKNTCKDVPEQEAMNHILGFTAMNDVSQRNIQNSDRSGWFRGKSFDTFGPIGPVLVPPEKLPNYGNVRIQCRLNGKVVQESNTKHMIFSVEQILSFISKNFTLSEGDIVLTGTPSGVGPLSHGDVVEIEIEGIGILRNPVE
jgi:2-keto-4-pentenoate hydratase/2-oxohepta-3-ene-1,7-dioic acid hydratase in catechol pathway